MIKVDNVFDGPGFWNFISIVTCVPFLKLLIILCVILRIQECNKDSGMISKDTLVNAVTRTKMFEFAKINICFGIKTSS